ncbi:hypothetical protein PVK06_033416 [Gossypium arboreum]|uniref:Uncharacterized protein n=1 Tax=Gossypium arboreum TaxID=29729 RepID=A0ABR0NC92_GOSAR|nr:hypothetical protein PVK06_033416 [Gossypium arboreum]
MYIAATIKRYRAVKEVGKIKMSVGVIAYYQLVQVCQAEYFRQLLKPVTLSKNEISDIVDGKLGIDSSCLVLMAIH